MRFNIMRNGIIFEVSPPYRLYLERVDKNRTTAQKHVWHASIILLSLDKVGTAAIMRQTGKSKTACGAGRALYHLYLFATEALIARLKPTSTGDEVRIA